jgi:hypothetical protein
MDSLGNGGHICLLQTQRDILAFHNGQEINNDFIVNYHLNHGSSILQVTMCRHRDDKVFEEPLRKKNIAGFHRR